MAIRQVVVGADGSAGSSAAIEWVAEFAQQTGAAVTVVHAIDLPDDLPDEAATRFHDAGRRSVEVLLDRWCMPLREAAVDHRSVLVDSPAAEAILQVAADVRADLVVVGRRGRGGVAQLPLGSVSNALVQSAQLPVLVLGPRTRTERPT